MVELKINLIIDNLKKVEKQVQNMFKNLGSDGGNSEKKKGTGAVAIGGAVAILSELLKNVKSVVGLLQIIGGMINSLVAPFVPILLGLIKPVFVLLNKMIQKVLQGFGILPKDDGTFASGTEIAGTGFGALLVAALVGTAGGTSFTTLLIAALVGAEVFQMGKWLGEKLADMTKDNVFDLGEWLSEHFPELSYDEEDVSLSESFSILKDKLGGEWDSLTTTLSDSFGALSDKLSSIWTSVQTTMVDSFNSLFNILDNVWFDVKTALVDSVNVLIGFINDIIKWINSKTEFLGFGGISTISEVRQPTRNQNPIQITINGEPSNETLERFLKLFRSEQNRNASFF